MCAAQIQQLKHSVSKGDKKKKKDITAQVAVLEAELDARHQQELKAFPEQDETASVSYDCLFVAVYINMCKVSSCW